MSAASHHREWAVQDAIADIAQRFDPFYVGSNQDASVQQISEYLQGQGCTPDVAMEAALRHVQSNDDLGAVGA